MTRCCGAGGWPGTCLSLSLETPRVLVTPPCDPLGCSGTSRHDPLVLRLPERASIPAERTSWAYPRPGRDGAGEIHEGV